MGMIYKPKWKRKDGTVVECSRYWIQYCRDGEVFRKSTECERHEDAKRILREREGDVARVCRSFPGWRRRPSPNSSTIW